LKPRFSLPLRRGFFYEETRLPGLSRSRVPLTDGQGGFQNHRLLIQHALANADPGPLLIYGGILATMAIATPRPIKPNAVRSQSQR
jgi:hypothetical protein